MMTPMTTQSTLPYELLLKIFICLSIDDLLRAQRVCQRWQQVFQDDPLWKSVCFEPPPQMGIPSICYILKQLPKLRNFTLQRTVSFYSSFGNPDLEILIDTLVKYCPELRSLKFHDSQRMRPLHVSAIRKNFLHLRNVHICVDDIVTEDVDSLNIHKLSSFHHLNSISLMCSMWPKNRSCFHPIAEGCHALKHFSIGYISSVSLEYLLERKKDQLISLTFGCYDMKSSTIELLGKCTVLQNLNMDMFFSNDDFSLKPIRKLTKLKTLALKNFEDPGREIFNMFDGEGFPHLQSLHIFFYSLNSNYSFDTLFEKCPNVIYLFLETYSSDVLPRQFQNIHRLTNLQSLQLQGFSNFSDETMDVIVSKCRRLSYFHLSGCDHLTNKSLEYLVKCVYLKEVVLDGCSQLTGSNFQLIPDKLKRLTRISLLLCNNMCKESLQELRKQMPHLAVTFTIMFVK